MAGAKAPTVSHTRYTVKGGKLPTMKTPHLSGIKSTVRMKSLKVGKKVTSYANPLAMKGK